MSRNTACTRRGSARPAEPRPSATICWPRFCGCLTRLAKPSFRGELIRLVESLPPEESRRAA